MRGLRALALLIACLAAGSSFAEPPPPRIDWLPEASRLEATALERPRPALAPWPEASPDAPSRSLAILGELLFHSPDLFGTLARRSGLSCQACHIYGTTNPDLFIAGLSVRPGGLDVTSGLFNPAAEDGHFNPRDIPSLRGVRLTAPYGRDGRFATLAEFVRHVIVTGFAGAEPEPLVVDALIAHLERLDFLPAPAVAPDGGLVETAPAAARRGEALFFRPFATRPDLACAVCHIPATHFTDHRRHDVGTGGLFDTPSLRNLAETPPYLHDGRAATLAEVIDHFAVNFSLELSPTERSDLRVYLETIGGTVDRLEPVTLAGELTRLERFSSLLPEVVARGDAALIQIVITALRRAHGELHDRFPESEPSALRDILVSRSLRLRDVEHFAAAGDFASATGALARYQALAGLTELLAATPPPGARFAPTR